MKKFISLCLLMTISFGFAHDIDVELKQDYSIDKTKIKRPGNQGR